MTTSATRPGDTVSGLTDRLLFDALLAASPVGLAFLDRDLRYVRVNEALASLNHTPVAEHVGRLMKDIVPTVAGRLEPELRHVLETGATLRDIELPEPGAAAGASGRHWVMSAYPIRDDRGTVVGIGVAVTDITRQREARDRLERLQAVTAALAFAAGPHDVAEVVVDQGVAALDARAGLLALVDPDGATLRMVRGIGYPPELLERWPTLPLDGGAPAAQAVRSGAALWLTNPTELMAAYALPGVPSTGNRAAAIVPLAVQGRVLGALVLSFADARTFEPDERRLVEAFAALAAQALDRARLYELEQQARIAAEAGHRRLQQVLDTLPEAVAIADAGSGRFVLCNRASVDLLGVDLTGQEVARGREPVLGSTHLDGTPFAAEDLPLQRALLHGETVVGLQLQHHNARDNRDVPMLVNSAPLYDAGGRIAGAMAVFQDVTPIRALDQRKDEFLGQVSHDVRNPITAIRGWAQILLRRVRRLPESEQAGLVEGLATIERVTGDAQRILDELLDLTRLQLGRPLDLRPGPVDLVGLVQAVAAAQQAATEAHAITVEASERELVGIWDQARLERVLENLVANSVKYSPDGGAIELTVERKPGWALLQVRDHGMGIPAADLPQVFERFFRAGNVRKTLPGTGLGLAGARQVVEQHGGSIAVESVEGQGSTFTVRLPFHAGRHRRV